MKTKHLAGRSYLTSFIRDTGDAIGGTIIGAQLATGVPSVGDLIIGIFLVCLSLYLEYKHNVEWEDVNKKYPPVGEEVIGFHQDWIHPDFNPKGHRICVLIDKTETLCGRVIDEWACAKWDSCQDEYVGSSQKPAYWKRIV